MDSILFPQYRHTKSQKLIVETPTNVRNNSSDLTVIASVLETPSETPSRKGYEQSSKGNESHKFSFLDDLPDLKSLKDISVTSILESELSDSNYSSPASRSSHEKCDLVNCDSCNIQLYDKSSNVNTKMRKLNITSNFRKSKKLINKDENLYPKGTNNTLEKLTLIKNARRKQVYTPNEDKVSLSQSKRAQQRENETICSFENSDLEMTDTQSGNIFLFKQTSSLSEPPCQFKQFQFSSTPNKEVQSNTHNNANTNSLRVLPTLSTINKENGSMQILSNPEYDSSSPKLPTPVERLRFSFSDSNTDSSFLPILKEVTAYVDVRCGAENRSNVFRDVLEMLGANVLPKFTSDVTHVIFKDGSKVTYRRAFKQHVHLVSPLWVDACKREMTWISESLYPISSDISNFDSPLHPANNINRKLRSMQPCTLREDLLKAEQRLEKKQRRKSATASRSSGHDDAPPHSLSSSAAKKEDFNSPLFRVQHLTPRITTDGGSVFGNSSMSTDEDDCNTPLAMRMYNKFCSPQVLPEKASLEQSSEHVSQNDFQYSTSPNSKRRRSRRLIERGEHVLQTSNQETKDAVLQKSTKGRKNITSPNSEVSRDVRHWQTTKRQKNTKCMNPEIPEANTKSVSPVLRDEPICSKGRIAMAFNVKRRLHTVSTEITDVELIIPTTPPDFQRRNIDSVPLYADINGKCLSQREEIKKRGKNIDCLDIIPLPRSHTGKKHQLDPYNNDFNDETSPKSTLRTKNSSRGSSRIDGHDGVNKKSGLHKGKKAQFGVSSESSAVDSPTLTNSSGNGQGVKKRFSLIATSRDSFEEFENSSKPQKMKFGTCRSNKQNLPTICLTNFSLCKEESAYSIVKALGSFKITSSINATTTHVVCGSEKRTFKVLSGISMGCWIVDESWLFESAEMRAWVPEEPFELFNFCPGAKISRECRMLPTSKLQNLFGSFGRIYTADDCKPSPHQIQKLLRNCGAKICSTLRSAELALCEVKLNQACEPSTPLVKVEWVFDSIQQWKLLNINKYLM